MGYIQISVQEKKEATNQDSKSLVLNCFGYKLAILLKGLVLFSRILNIILHFGDLVILNYLY